jgi:hypothetical protein
MEPEKGLVATTPRTPPRFKESWEVTTTASPGVVIVGRGSTKRGALQDALDQIASELHNLRLRMDIYSMPKAQLEAELAALGPEGDGGSG